MRYEVQRLKALKRHKERRKTQEQSVAQNHHSFKGQWSAGGSGSGVGIVGFGGGSGVVGGSGSSAVISSGHSHTLGHHTHTIGTASNLGAAYNGGSQVVSGGGISILMVDDVPEIPGETPDWDEFRAEISGRLHGMECCIGCRRFYHPYTQLEQDKLQDEIDELRAEVLHPLEVLALEAA